MRKIFNIKSTILNKQWNTILEKLSRTGKRNGKRIKYIKRLVSKYKQTQDLKERLILNHIIVLSNVFGVEPCVRMLFYKIDKTDYSILKTFLLFLNYMPNIVRGIRGKDILSSDIIVDMTIANILRKIK